MSSAGLWMQQRSLARTGSNPMPATVCLFATFVLNQFPRDVLVRFGQLLVALSRRRELHLIVMGFSEFIEAGTPLTGDVAVWHLRLSGGRGEYRLLAHANPHGRWLEPMPNSGWKSWTAPV